MTGFKSGAGDPFGDDELEDDDGQDTNESQSSDSVDIDDLPYLAERQLRGVAVNADRSKQLRLQVREFVERGEDAFVQELQERLDTSVHKADAREAAMVVAHENPELVAAKLREWGIDYLND